MQDATVQSYQEIAYKHYGTACEFIVNGQPCGWEEASCDIHHIDYQEHQAKEDEMRRMLGDASYQMGKNNDKKNLCVICPNHHRLTHHKDLGLGVLHHLPSRKI
jgi:hypothetical protein